MSVCHMFNKVLTYLPLYRELPAKVDPSPVVLEMHQAKHRAQPTQS